jgi:hypothetical protein
VCTSFKKVVGVVRFRAPLRRSGDQATQ